jgi:hypothetical protein
MLSGWASEIVAWAISDLVHHTGDEIGFNSWEPVYASYPFPEPTAESCGILCETANTRDDQNNLINADVYIDGKPAGSYNPSVYLTPETHYISVTRYVPISGGYGYIFTDMVIEGNTYYDNVVETQLTTNSTITAHYTYGWLPHADVTVRAWDQYTCTEIYGLTIYCNGQYFGTTPLSDSTSLLPGTYTFANDYPATYICVNGGQQYGSGYSIDVNLDTSPILIDFYFN